MNFRFVTADEREKLYNEIWTEPVTIVAKRYNISDTGLRKHCIRLGIPLPYSGYWAKVRAGKKPHKVNLPPVTGELRKYIRNYAIKYRTDIENLTDAELMVNEELNLLKEETKIFIKEKCDQVHVKDQLRNPHRLITEHKEGIKYRKERDKKLNQAKFNTNYYASAKGEYTENKPILPITVSNSNLNRVYKILDTIIKTLEDMEGHTRFEWQNSGKDTAYFLVMRTTFYFEFKEKHRKVTVSKNNDEAKPNLVLTLLPKSWFRNNSSDIMVYEDNDSELLEEQLGRVIYDMFVVANRLLATDQMEEREKKRKEEEQERLRRLEKMRKGELEELKLLEQVSSDWDKAQKIRKFTDYMEMKIAEVADKEKRRKLLDWLQWARDKADWIDPLIEKDDELLGKSQYLFDEIADMDL